MAEYICREDVLKKAKSSISVPADNEWDCGYNTAMAEMQEFIKHLTASDVQPIRHGRWDFQGYQLFKCTNCKEMFTQDQLEAMQNHKDCEECTFPNFCPNCGARMDGQVS